MAKIKISFYGGIMPSVPARQLRPENATRAEALLPTVSEFRPQLDHVDYAGALSVNEPVTIHRLARDALGDFNDDLSSGWKAYANHRNLVKWPSNDNDTERTSVTSQDGSTQPRAIDATGADRQLGVPVPSQPTLTLVKGDYFTEEDRAALLERIRGQVADAFRAAMVRMKIGSPYTGDLIQGYLEHGAEEADPPELWRSRVHRYDAFEGTITDAYTAALEADVAWLRTTRLGYWFQAGATPAWLGVGNWHYGLKYLAYGAGYRLDEAAARTALKATEGGPSTGDSGTEALLHFDGANGATSTTDSSEHERTVTMVGAVVLSTTAPAMGTAWADFNGGRITVGEGQDWAFMHAPNGKYLVRWRGGIKFDNFAANRMILATSIGTTPGMSFSINTSRQFTFAMFGLAGQQIFGSTFATAFPNDANFHTLDLAVDLDAGIAECTVDGASLGTVFRLPGLPTTQPASYPLTLGANIDGTQAMLGGMDEFEVISGRTVAAGGASAEPGDVLTDAQINTLISKMVELLDPDGQYANPYVQPLRDKVTEFEALLEQRPQGADDSATTTAKVTAAQVAAANAIFDKLAQFASVHTQGAG